MRFPAARPRKTCDSVPLGMLSLPPAPSSLALLTRPTGNDSSVPYIPPLFLDVDQPLSLFLPLLELMTSKSSLRVARLPRDVLARVLIVRSLDCVKYRV